MDFVNGPLHIRIIYIQYEEINFHCTKFSNKSKYTYGKAPEKRN